jgi:transposase, IS30 family
MSKNYKQLNSVQRYQIEALLLNGTTQKLIAITIGVSASTVSRELKRNIAKRGRSALEYRAKNAQRRTDQRHSEKPKYVRFSTLMKTYARKKLAEDKLSPELIEVEGKREYGEFVSHETIYKWIWQTKAGNKREDRQDKRLYKYLAHGRRRRKRGNRRDSRGLIPNRVSIEHRSPIVAKRNRIGDMEVDLMMGKNHKGSILVMIDRASLYTKLELLTSKNSKVIAKKIINRWGKVKGIIKTITFDNDQAFSQHQTVAQNLNAKTYFTRPYTSQDKGSVENRIGVLRRFFPKKTDLTMVTKKDVKQVETKLNNRPVRKFNYKTPNKVFSDKIALIA